MKCVTKRRLLYCFPRESLHFFADSASKRTARDDKVSVDKAYVDKVSAVSFMHGQLQILFPGLR